MIDLGRVANNVITVSVLSSFFYLVWSKVAKGDSDTAVKIRNLIKGRRNDGNI